MSRHLVVDRPDFQLVVGFDHPLRSFFGQVMRGERAIDGWPTRQGLGMRRPVTAAFEATRDLNLLLTWARERRPQSDPCDAERLARIEALRPILLEEWAQGADLASSPLPAVLDGGRRDA